MDQNVTKYLFRLKRNIQFFLTISIPVKTSYLSCTKASKLAELLEAYDEIFKKQTELGITESAEKPDRLGESNYLPNHLVIRSDKEATKL